VTKSLSGPKTATSVRPSRSELSLSTEDGSIAFCFFFFEVQSVMASQETSRDEIRRYG
jgi:hypothetical protein